MGKWNGSTGSDEQRLLPAHADVQPRGRQEAAGGIPAAIQRPHHDMPGYAVAQPGAGNSTQALCGKACGHRRAARQGSRLFGKACRTAPSHCIAFLPQSSSGRICFANLHLSLDCVLWALCNLCLTRIHFHVKICSAWLENQAFLYYNLLCLFMYRRRMNTWQDHLRIMWII